MIVLVLFLFTSITFLTLAKEFKWFLPFRGSTLFTHLEVFIPRWSFFAPIPCTHDYYLLFRHLEAKGTLSPWQNAFPLSQRPFYSFLWNPGKRKMKAVLDVTLDLLKYIQKEKDEKQICVSLPYLQLLNHINSLCTNSKATKVQFTILSHSQSSEYEVAFVSELHVVG